MSPTAKVDWSTPRPTDMIKLLMYAQPGNGKTWLCASVVDSEDMMPALMLSAAGNPQSIWDWEYKPDTFVISALEELNPFYDWFAMGQPTELNGKPVGMVERLGLTPPYRTLIVDGMTELQRWSLAIAGGHDKLSIGTQPRQLQIQEFNPVLAHTTRMAALFFSLAELSATLPVHVLITSLEWEKLDIRTQTRDIRPLIWGSGGAELAGYAMIVCRLQQAATVARNVKRSMGEKPDLEGTTIAFFKASPHTPFNKDQWNRLGDYMVDPTMSKIVDLVYGEKPSTRKYIEPAEEQSTDE